MLVYQEHYESASFALEARVHRHPAIRIFDFPQDHAEMIELSMLWHSRVHDDPGSLWLRALIREAVNLSPDALRPLGSVDRTSASASIAKKAKKVPARTGSYRANRVAGN